MLTVGTTAIPRPGDYEYLYRAVRVKLQPASMILVASSLISTVVLAPTGTRYLPKP